LWFHSLKVAQLLSSAACLHTNQFRSYLNHLVISYIYQLTIHPRVESGEAAETSPAETQQTVSDCFFWIQQTAIVHVGTSIGTIPRDSTCKKSALSALIDLHNMNGIDCG